MRGVANLAAGALSMLDGGNEVGIGWLWFQIRFSYLCFLKKLHCCAA